jgi:hypothetical protein
LLPVLVSLKDHLGRGCPLLGHVLSFPGHGHSSLGCTHAGWGLAWTLSLGGLES